MLGADHLAARAREVARSQRVGLPSRPLRPARLLGRLADTRRILADAHARLLDASSSGVDTGPAAEWLLDNYYVLQEQLQEVRSSLPRDYYRELPELTSGPLTGYPRVYEMAISLISHTEARIDVANVDLYVESYQSVTPLTIGELWAMPLMLRMGLIESVRRMTLRTLQRLDERDLASTWAGWLIEAGARGGADLRAALRLFAEADLPLTPDFVARLLQALRQAEGTSPSLLWLEQWMREAGGSPEQAVAVSTQRLALTQIMMGNSITGLRNIGRRDWRRFVESQSVMEAVLREDPAGFYPLMTFETRDLYRHAVERVAKGTKHREASVAQWAIDLASRAAPSGESHDESRTHVGYYLVDDGLIELERMAGYTPTLRERAERWVQAHPNKVFVGGLALCFAGAVLAVLTLVDESAHRVLWLVLLLAFLPALDVAVSLFNQLVTTWLPPRTLPRLDLHEHGVPARYRTAVVVPILVGDVEDMHLAVENLEVQYLANREAHLHFALLSDFTDASTETTAQDDAIITAGLASIAALNERHASGQPEVFHLLHRPRRWNAAQGVWMGWERKRGKLADFNRLLRDGIDDVFSVISSDASMLRQVRYVITLDADTVLPPDAAPALIGAMAHPLNRPVYDERHQEIVRGFGILQPRVGVSLPSAQQSSFAKIASGDPGVDPYSVAASDVYQDLYGEGSFTGKGIYDVDAFQFATHGRFPENVLLSHDLLEGNYARAGLATDIVVYDDYPSTYDAFTRRKHRWIRGDWQLLPWLGRWVPGPDGRERNRLSLISRWKIIDNLRRSTVELVQLLFLIGGWTVLPGSPLRWTLLGIGAIIAPWVIALLRALVQPPFDKSWRAYYGAVMRDTRTSAHQALLAVAFLPHQAFNAIDAITRTLYRLVISRKHLLDWQSASHVQRESRTLGGGVSGIRSTAVIMFSIATAITALAVRRQLSAPQPVVPLVVSGLALWSVVALWMAAPAIARRLSTTTDAPRRPLTESARATAMRYAAKHWAFFDQFVTEETAWLAPDNFQSDPEPVVAMRTSPTNLGLQLLSTVSACDLEFIVPEDMTARLERTFHTLAQLPRYRGHFYNWYDLNDLRVLEPAYISTVDSGNLAGHLLALRQACLEYATRHPDLSARLHNIADQSYTFVVEMDFAFLYDSVRKLFTIGYHPDSFTPDDSHYDLLASEARLASFVAIAKNEVPVEHWFRLSRTLNRAAGSMALVSWSGSMFEYLMPALVMRSLPLTMLDQTYHGAVARHRAYARARGVPWGVSESAYNVRDRHSTYQYRAFGVADLALKRGLGHDLVVAPYASALAAMVDPPRALANLRAIEALGAFGTYGFCDALDFTRPAPGERFSLVQTWMAHHVGMTIVSLCNVLRDDQWQGRFHADSMVKSAEVLLHERVPRRLVTPAAQQARADDALPDSTDSEPVSREVNTLHPSAPRVSLLGSDDYAVMLNHNGSGFSRYEGLAVTRWRSDATSDATGQFFYLKDMISGRVWSAGAQPVATPPDRSRTSLGSDRVTLHRTDGDIDTHTSITVVPGDSAEVRTITLTNSGHRSRDIEITSYGELVLAPPDSDRAHAAFSNLFVETEWHAWCTAITATRRPRTPSDPRLWCVHVVDAGSDRLGSVSCETDRARFIGRGRSVRDPIALEADGALSGSTGAVLDPIFSLRTRVRVQPGQSVSVAFTTLIATTRDAAFALADRYHDSHAARRALEFAWSATQIELRELGITPTNAAVFQDLATQLLYRGGSLAPPPDEVRRNKSSQHALWAHGVSGDIPIVLATIDSTDGLPTLRELFTAHRFWRRRGVAVDLVVINAQPHDYLQELRDGIADAMVLANDATLVDQPGGVFVRRRDDFRAEGYLALSAMARVTISCDGRSLARVLANADTAARSALARASDRATPIAVPTISVASPLETESLFDAGGALASLVSAFRPLVTLQRPVTVAVTDREPAEPLRFDNSIGGLDARNDYCMRIDDEHLPPAPWANVIANPQGGFLVSERGGGCVWAENAYFYRLTPWHNDPIADPASDAIYIRDVDRDELWSATPAPVRSAGVYRVRHAPGSSTFEHERTGIASELTLGLPEDAAVKVSLLRLHNRSDRRRKLQVTAYAEWTLGARREETQHHVRTRFAGDQHAIFAQNHFDPAFAAWTAFLACSESVSSHTADRQSFLGRDGNLAAPAGLSMSGLNGSSGVGLDPCGALQMEIVLAPGESRELVVLLGAASTEVEARELVSRLRVPTAARAAVNENLQAWDRRLGTIAVRTPDPAFDAMINRWTLYQALSCRMWARMGLYQSSGAFGFRDQLQDVMAFVYAEPAIARAHIIRASARQFVEGDVQHWWHPHTGRGVRTRFSDDLAWLPYVVDQYVRTTGDATVLDELAPFITMSALDAHEHERYDLPQVTEEQASVYEHCCRALRRACTTGAHGLPLIGTGDWNDGMSRVGAEGRGESVWLAWFLITTLRAFAVHADARGEVEDALFMRTQADAYRDAIEAHAWDGGWYRRAYYDDGTSLGSVGNDECRIDAIAQSWSVISGAGRPDRQRLAMDAMNQQLVREDARLIMLLTPPFDRGVADPGYIKGYIPGVRENGAQYTHAALWAVLATAMQGKGDRAFELFQMLNPLTHSATEAGMERYKVEPYVVAADVYTAPTQLGRGGWTWYTGSASWMYRIGLEHILGFEQSGNQLRVQPCVPADWPEFVITYRYGTSTYEIVVRDPGLLRTHGAHIFVDDIAQSGDAIVLVDDGRTHRVRIEALGVREPAHHVLLA